MHVGIQYLDSYNEVQRIWLIFQPNSANNAHKTYWRLSVHKAAIFFAPENTIDTTGSGGTYDFMFHLKRDKLTVRVNDVETTLDLDLQELWQSTSVSFLMSAVECRVHFSNLRFRTFEGSRFLAVVKGSGTVSNTQGTSIASTMRPAKSCLDWLRRGDASSGVKEIDIDGAIQRVLCDQTFNGGGWTLILSSTQGYWHSTIGSLNEDNPSLLSSYSILNKADSIKNNGNSNSARFEYRLEGAREVLGTQQECGGIYNVPRDYTFVANTNSQTDVRRTAVFSNDCYKFTSTQTFEVEGCDRGIDRRMPWLFKSSTSSCTGLTTSDGREGGCVEWWGSLALEKQDWGGDVAPWIQGDTDTNKAYCNRPVGIYYWLREDMA